LTLFASRAVRILAILASGCLVAGFALATLFPPSFTLAHLITRWTDTGVASLERFLMAAWPWAWRSLAVPMLSRPAWLAPVDLALVMGGVAGSLAIRHAATAQRERG